MHEEQKKEVRTGAKKQRAAMKKPVSDEVDRSESQCSDEPSEPSGDLEELAKRHHRRDSQEDESDLSRVSKSSGELLHENLKCGFRSFGHLKKLTQLTDKVPVGNKALVKEMRHEIQQIMYDISKYINPKYREPLNQPMQDAQHTNNACAQSNVNNQYTPFMGNNLANQMPNQIA